jgi:hypothetical protein
MSCARSQGNIKINADDGLDAFLFTGHVKVDDAVHISGISDGKRLHAVAFLLRQRGRQFSGGRSKGSSASGREGE